MKSKKNNKSLGNPLLAKAVATEAATKMAPIVIKTGTKVAKVVGISIAGLVAYGFIKKTLHKAQAKKFLEQSGTDNNVQIAMLIFNEIPDEYVENVKWYNPITWVNGIWNEAKGIVTNIDSEKVIALGAKITDFDKVLKAFKAIYNLDMLVILQKAMKPEDFLTFTKSGKQDNTPYQTIDNKLTGQYIIPKKQTSVYRKRILKDSTAPGGKKIGFETIIVDSNTLIGKASGLKYYLKEFKKYFYETSISGSKNIYKVYIVTDDAKFLNATEYSNKKNKLKTIVVNLMSNEIFD
jgi:hypothetical protein